jgi:metallophosphoesterase (TIGR00282 family)
MSPFFRLLFIGDVVGRPGRVAVGSILPELKGQYKPQLVIANGENLAGGLGLTQGTADEVFSYGVDLLTTGNHVWDRKEFLSYIDLDDRILRPANYPRGAPGKGHTVVELKNRSGIDVECPGSRAGDRASRAAVLNLSGRVFMDHLDDPFAMAMSIIPELRQETDVIILDFHAEATSEKVAMGWYLDGQVSAVIGTHTHVQTADDRILPNHTAYITDVGMTGPVDSVIGMRKDLVIQKFLTQMPVRFEVPKGDAIFSAVVVDVDPASGKAISIERLQIKP